MDPLRSLRGCCDLTERQREIALLVIQAKCDKDIATHCGISVRTVRCHLAEIYRKLGVATRFELFARVLGR